MVISGQITTIAARVHDVGIPGINRNVAAFSTTHRIPIPFGNAKTGRAAGNTDGAIVLLGPVHAVRKLAVHGHMVELRGGIFLIRPAFSTIITDVGTPIIGFNHALRVVGINPQVVVVPMGCGNGLKGFAAIGGFVKADIQHVHRFRRFGVSNDVGIIKCPLAKILVAVGAHPGFAAILRPKNPALFGLDDGIHQVFLRGRHRNANFTNHSFW